MITFDSRIKTIAIIGCGGVTSWLIAPLFKLLQSSDTTPELLLVDGDTIEHRNLERQWFSEEDVGKNKAAALCSKLDDGYPVLPAVESFYSDGTELPLNGLTLFIGAADNHAARRAILNAVDRGLGWAIIAGNEYIESEAYYYEKSFLDTPCDPRVYYPSIRTDRSGDPTAPRGCTGLAAEIAPQLVLANLSAANAALMLLHHHFVERPAMDNYIRDYMPVKVWNLSTNFRTTRACDLMPKE